MADTPAETPAGTPVPANVDVVAMPSLRADGTPDQTPGYLVLDHTGTPGPASEYSDPRAAAQPAADESAAPKTAK